MTQPSDAPADQGKETWDEGWQRALEDVRPPDEPTFENDVDARKVDFLRDRLPAGGRVLEVGCGSARLLCRFGREGTYELVALDNAPSALELANATAAKFGVELTTVVGDAYQLPFESGSFQLVASGGLLEHFEDPKPILAEMARVLAPGGVFYADVVPRRISWYRIKEARRMMQSTEMAPGVYESDFASSTYRRWLEELGVGQLKIRPAGIYPPFTRRMKTQPRRRLMSALSFLEHTPLAERLSWYFMISGIKV